jgi:hypothetical protein
MSFRAKPEAKSRNLWNLQDLSKRRLDFARYDSNGIEFVDSH